MRSACCAAISTGATTTPKRRSDARLAPAIVDMMQPQGAHFSARMFRFVPGAAVTALSALVGIRLVRRG
ncbi:hypothetical protein CFB46_02810 [Burkholderia sp. HI2761]|nr:hypothetical protein [Burkholderia sp. BE24]OXJ29985.1 hypothetical protein CFB46_02810 [Burkholderia sp. HI2761]